MTNLRSTIIPKSDQLNYDDLIGGATMTIRVTKVSKADGDQPISINFEGDNGKPFKPCKSMRRVLISLWGEDGNRFIGRSMTLYGDPTVKFGGGEVGGIRISHMSDIDKPVTMALTATRASRKPYTVHPLVVSSAPSTAPKHNANIDDLKKLAADLAREIEMTESRVELLKLETRCNDLAQKLMAAGQSKSHDKLFAIYETQRSKFATNPVMGS